MVNYQPNVPLPDDNRNKSQSDFLANYQYLAASIGNDHNFSLTNPNTLGPEKINNDGFHNLTHWINQGTELQSGIPTPIEGVGQLYTKTVSGTGIITSEQLCYERGTGARANDEICLTVMPIRAAVSFSNLGVISSSYNVSSVTGPLLGVFTIKFAKPMPGPTTNYIVQATSSIGIVNFRDKNLDTLEVITVNGSGSAINTAFVDLVVFGG